MLFKNYTRPVKALTVVVDFVGLERRPLLSERHRKLRPKLRRHFAAKVHEAIERVEAEESTTSIVHVEFTARVSESTAGDLVDAWLTPRLQWSVSDESASRVVLHRAQGHVSLGPLLGAIEAAQFRRRVGRVVLS